MSMKNSENIAKLKESISDLLKEVDSIKESKTIDSFRKKRLLKKASVQISIKRQLILYLETDPKEEFIKEEIERTKQKIETRKEIIKNIQTKQISQHLSKKEESAAIREADYKEFSIYLKHLEQCL